jgi:TetR/AcrR family transcriptional regulator, transcriptional repressor for nem operon
MDGLQEFDRTEVLDRALDLFWSHGYETSSISKLLDVMGINLSSLYSEFGGKRSLFREILGHYFRTLEDLFSRTLIEIKDPLQALQAFYYGALLTGDEEKLFKGCLLFNAVSELNSTMPEMADEAAVYLFKIRALFFRRLLEARDKGMIDKDENLEIQADYLLAMLSGLRSLSKMGAAPQVLRLVIDTALGRLFKNTIKP